jgi:hypothetical protein
MNRVSVSKLVSGDFLSVRVPILDIADSFVYCLAYVRVQLIGFVDAADDLDFLDENVRRSRERIIVFLHEVAEFLQHAS